METVRDLTLHVDALLSAMQTNAELVCTRNALRQGTRPDTAAAERPGGEVAVGYRGGEDPGVLRRLRWHRL